MVGYVDGSLNAEVLDDEGWFYTGDVGVVDEAGYVTITGRIKDIINRGGEKFSARDIEDLLSAHPAVAEVAVVGLPDKRLGERVGAAVVIRPGSHADDDELRAYLEEQKVARQKIPVEFSYVSELPRTPSGKVQKFRLLNEWR
jgi:acyl-CoA synthetase